MVLDGFFLRRYPRFASVCCVPLYHFLESEVSKSPSSYPLNSHCHMILSIPLSYPFMGHRFLILLQMFFVGVQPVEWC